MRQLKLKRAAKIRKKIIKDPFEKILIKLRVSIEEMTKNGRNCKIFGI